MPEQETKAIRGAVQRVDHRDGRFYVWEGEKYWSVTTIIDGGTPKWALINWAKKFTAEYAVEHFDAFEALVKDDPMAAVDWLKRASNRMVSVAGAVGSAVHEAAEAHVLGRPMPPWEPEVKPYMVNGFLPFLQDWKPEFEAVEAPVFSKTHRYAGTLDNILTIDGTKLLTDYKTSKSGIWPDTALQLAAYRFAESYIGLPDGDMEPLPEVDGAVAIHLRPNGYSLIPVRADREVFEAFLFIREVFRWQEETSKTAVGRVVKPNATVCATCQHHALLHGARGCFVMLAAGDALLVEVGVSEDHECPCANFRAFPLKHDEVIVR